MPEGTDDIDAVPDEFLTVHEVAARLKVNQQTVRNWIADRQLRAVRIGQRRVRIRSTDLDDFFEAGGDSSPRRSPSQGTRLTQLEARVLQLAATVEALTERLEEKAGESESRV